MITQELLQIMGTCGWLATTLDQEKLERTGTGYIYPRRTPQSQMKPKHGDVVSKELGGRYLLYYLRGQDVGRYASGRKSTTFVTPTPYSPEETIIFLCLPWPTEPRNYAILIDPSMLPEEYEIYGPRWVALGPGIEYILKDGFTVDAIVAPPGAAPPWEIMVR